MPVAPVTPPPARLVALVGGPLVFLVCLALPPPAPLSVEMWHVIALTLFMLIWWIFQAVPLAATAFLPLVLLPPLEVLTIREATAPYANPVVYLLMGGFILALGFEKSGLHRRIVFEILRRVGASANRLVFGFMFASWFLSMWMSNTATTAVMLPIVLSLLATLFNIHGEEDMPPESEGRGRFALTLLLGVAFAANIGGTATLIGTAPNALFAGFMLNEAGIETSFGGWMLFALPFAALMLVVSWAVLVYLIYPNRLGTLTEAGRIITKAHATLGDWTREEKTAAAIFALAVFLWLFKGVMPFAISNAGIAIGVGILGFVVPIRKGSDPALLNWRDTERMPWGVLVLFGGGLALAAAMQSSGLGALIGELLAMQSGWGAGLFLLLVIAVIIFMTEMTSNTALLSLMLPTLAGLALALDVPITTFALPATLAASCAFMLPTATPPNAIVFASGMIRIPQMMRAGFILNIIAIFLIWIIVSLWGENIGV